MKKEILIAIVIGLSVGLIIAYGIWTANKSLKKVTPEKASVSEEQTTAMPTPAVISLQIDTPSHDFISDQEKITVSGKTFPQATLAIIYPEGEKIFEADQEGKFSAEITLVGGTNEIEIQAFDNENNQESITIYGVYSTAEI